MQSKRINLYKKFREKAADASEFDKKYANFTAWEGINFKDDTSVSQIWNKSLKANLWAPDLNEFYKTFACDLEWAKTTNYCKSTPPKPDNQGSSNQQGGGSNQNQGSSNQQGGGSSNQQSAPAPTPAPTPAPQQPSSGTAEDTRKDAKGWGMCLSNIPTMPVYILINIDNNKPIDFDFIEDVAIKKKDAHKLKDRIKIVEEKVKSVDINCNFKGNNFENDGECDMVILKDGTYLTNAIAKRGTYHCSMRGKFEFDDLEYGPLKESKIRQIVKLNLKNLIN